MSTTSIAPRVAGHGELLDRYLPCVSPSMQTLAASISRVAATAAAVLISGETGTGKSTLAQQLYEDSPDHVAALIVLHGGSTTAESISDLASLAGRTVLLEEVGELAPATQNSLVRLMASSDHVLRFVATSSQDLVELVARRVLRADLLYRLDVVRLDIPPLRQRPEDIIFLAEHFLTLAARYFQRDVRALGPDAHACLLRHSWPGNVRELRNCIFESVLRCPHALLRAADLLLRPAEAATEPEAEFGRVLSKLSAAHPREFYRRVHRLMLEWALATSGGNGIQAATLLGIGRGSLRTKLRREGLATAPASRSLLASRSPR